MLALNSLRQKIGQMILLGFEGSTLYDPWVINIKKHLLRGEIGGIILFEENVYDKSTLIKLIKFFNENSVSYPLFISVDQEGGKVQRFSSKNGFTDFLSAKDVSKLKTPEEARIYYRSLALELKEIGINLNFGPVVDLDGVCPVIGGLGRSFSSEVQDVVSYASSFIGAHRDLNLLTCIKHFPGHGFANQDSHKEIVDVSSTFKKIELDPFKQLIKREKVDSIMTGHLINRSLGINNPATLSLKSTKLLRDEFNYDGVIITDDLHMGAILKNFSMKEVVIKSINAGSDILLFSNNKKAMSGCKFVPDMNIVSHVIEIVINAIDSGLIDINRVDHSYNRIVNLKKRLSLG